MSGERSETSEYDFANRGRRLVLPIDPDFDSGGPTVSGELDLDPRGLPIAARALIDAEAIEVLGEVDYDQYGQVETRSWGPSGSPLLEEAFTYDPRNRPITHTATRSATSGTSAGEIGAITEVANEQLGWDAASNLIGILDFRDPDEWPIGHRIRNTAIGHDSLYRVTSVDYEYRIDDTTEGDDAADDWRSEAAPVNVNDPGDRTPRAGARSATSTGRTRHPRAPQHLGEMPEDRVRTLDYDWDWLGNEVERLDDQYSFYERSLGTLTSGNDVDAGGGRPSALYLATNIDDTGGVESTWDGAGWVEVVYGISGNVTSFTVHGECHDVSSGSCVDDTSDTVETRRDDLRTNCTCADEQHYSFRWDELNRLVDGRRYDRESGDWVPAARMRYRYDGANQRTVKQTFAEGAPNTEERVALYIYPGDFERRGLLRDTDRYTAIVEDEVDDSETQYMVAGARIVWAADPDGFMHPIDNNRRATINVTDLLGTTGAVVDLESGDLVEVSTYYPSGARENLWTNDALTPIEPSGFTGKEADEEIGMTYFGERWLIPRLGRWATPDPLHVHASGGGEAGNSYHYVGGSLLQAVDPLGLDEVEVQQALRAVQSAVDEHGPGYDGTSAGGTRQHGRVELTLRQAAQTGRLSRGAADRILTEAVIDPDGTVVAFGEHGGPSSITRLRQDGDLIGRLRAAGRTADLVEEGGRTMVRPGYFRVVDQLVATGDAGEVARIRGGRLSARGRVFALDTKFGGSLRGTADLQSRLGTRQVAVRPGGDVIASLQRIGTRVGRAASFLGFLADAAPFMNSLLTGMGVLGGVMELSEIPQRAMQISGEIREQIFRGVDREVGVIDAAITEGQVGVPRRGTMLQWQREDAQAEYEMFGAAGQSL